jgi:hypothetical protein
MEKEKVGGTLIGCLDIARMGVGGVGVAAKAYAAAVATVAATAAAEQATL